MSMIAVTVSVLPEAGHPDRGECWGLNSVSTKQSPLSLFEVPKFRDVGRACVLVDCFHRVRLGHAGLAGDPPVVNDDEGAGAGTRGRGEPSRLGRCRRGGARRAGTAVGRETRAGGGGTPFPGRGPLNAQSTSSQTTRWLSTGRPTLVG